MKKLVVLALMFSSSVSAQIFGPGLQFTTTNPAGNSCVSTSVVVYMPSGALYTCSNGTLTLVAGGGGGAAAFPSITGGTNNSGAAMVVASPSSFTVPTQTSGDASGLTASDQFVAVALSSVNPAVAVQAGTTGVLSNTPTYNNGTAGVGATLTAGSNGALTIDGYSPVLNDRVLIKNQASALQNGVYTLTTLGDSMTEYVLTRATDYNSTTNINYTGTIPVLQGTTNANTGWNLNTQITAVGTSTLSYTQSSSGTGGIPAGGNVKAQGNLPNGNALEGAGGKTIVDSGVAFSKLTQTIGSGTIALTTSAISSATCSTASTVTVTGTATTDAVIATLNADPTATTGYLPSTSGSLYIWIYPTTNTVNAKVCNNTSGSITPGAATLNVRVVR